MCCPSCSLNPDCPLIIFVIFSFLSDGVVLVDPTLLKEKKGVKFYALFVSEIVSPLLK